VTAVLRRRVDALALDVGRLRRHLDGDTYAGFLAWRVANGIEAIDCLLEATAAELFRGNVAFGLDDEEAVAEALATVDARSRTLRRALGVES
jgi:VIT1/CCC1 family predicted Fe2+/Mn2+ transporter